MSAKGLHAATIPALLTVAINTPCGLQHAIEQVLYLHLVGHVGLHARVSCPSPAETLHQLWAATAWLRQQKRASLLGRQQHGRRTNAPAAARDEHHRHPVPDTPEGGVQRSRDMPTRRLGRHQLNTTLLNRRR